MKPAKPIPAATSQKMNSSASWRTFSSTSSSSSIPSKPTSEAFVHDITNAARQKNSTETAATGKLKPPKENNTPPSGGPNVEPMPIQASAWPAIWLTTSGKRSAIFVYTHVSTMPSPMPANQADMKRAANNGVPCMRPTIGVNAKHTKDVADNVKPEVNKVPWPKRLPRRGINGCTAITANGWAARNTPACAKVKPCASIHGVR
mmetsp:Transcript_10470/g.27735  ORF Transcript_10470/g.27735 Transcript_10470/m.27735 type:complete len:204 (+) Transcript_10470:573-1184(+)